MKTIKQIYKEQVPTDKDLPDTFYILIEHWLRDRRQHFLRKRWSATATIDELLKEMPP